jgi:hypothetical protein
MHDSPTLKGAAESGSDAPTCSPSSFTPETDELDRTKFDRDPNRVIYFTAYMDALELCRKLERERDNARATAATFRQCAEITFGTMPFPRKFHWENAEAIRPATKTTNEANQ